MRGLSHAGDRDGRSAGDVRPCAYVPLHLPGDDGPIQNSQSMHFMSYGQTDSLDRGCHEAVARAVALASAVSSFRRRAMNLHRLQPFVLHLRDQALELGLIETDGVLAVAGFFSHDVPVGHPAELLAFYSAFEHDQ